MSSTARGPFSWISVSAAAQRVLAASIFVADVYFIFEWIGRAEEQCFFAGLAVGIGAGMATLQGASPWLGVLLAAMVA